MMAELGQAALRLATSFFLHSGARPAPGDPRLADSRAAARVRRGWRPTPGVRARRPARPLRWRSDQFTL